MIDHISIAVQDLEAGTAFYERILSPLGLTLLVTREDTVGFGKKYPEFWINARPEMIVLPNNHGAHICLRAPSNDAVTEFHDVAIKNGGKSDGAPGERQAAMTTYFGAFIIDPFGNKIEAVCFPKST